MIRRRDHKFGKRDGGRTGVLVRVMVGLCVVSSMALVLQLNIANQQKGVLRNIKGVEEPRVWSAQPAHPTCRPHRHLVFLKTHKCGSSTVQNMLMRYASTNNLSVILPPSGVYLDFGPEIQGLRVKDFKGSPFAPPSGKYHFLIHHTRLNVRVIQQLTYDDSVWVTIVRKPAVLFESMFHYYSLNEFYGATFDHLVWKLEGNDGGKFKFKNSNNRFAGRLGRNQMSFDLGMEHLDTRQEAVLRQAITLLDHTFHLVMVAEKMDESLVLLKHLMCWRDEDILAVSRNVRKDRYRSFISQQSMNTLDRFNSADLKLYNHFKDRFEKQVQEFGRGRMEEEVGRMRKYREKVWQQCGMQEVAATSGRQREQHQKYQHLIVQFEPHANDSQSHQRFCKDLVRPAVEFTQVLRWKQYSRYHHNTNNPWNLTWSPAFRRKTGKRKTPRKGAGAVSLGHKTHPRRPPAQSKPYGRRKGRRRMESPSIPRSKEKQSSTSSAAAPHDKHNSNTDYTETPSIVAFRKLMLFSPKFSLHAMLSKA